LTKQQQALLYATVTGLLGDKEAVKGKSLKDAMQTNPSSKFSRVKSENSGSCLRARQIDNGK